VLRAGQLLTQWRQESLATFWSEPAAWWTPAIEAVADALTGRTGPDSAAASNALGGQRAAAGVFLDEARTDLLIAARVARLERADRATIIDALTLGWTNRTLDTVFTVDCVDPLTELATPGYLVTRLDELYAEASWTGEPVAQGYALVVVRLAPVSERLEAETQMILAQTALRAVFPAGQTLARVTPHCVGVLARRREPMLSRSLRDAAAELELAVQEHRLRSYRIWLETLPPEFSQLPALLRQLQ